MMHLLDNNAFSEAHRTYYPLDLAPTFWDWLENGQLIDDVGSIVAIRDELTAGDPKGRRYPLAAWAMSIRGDFWHDPTPESAAAMVVVARWAASPKRKYRQSAVSEFMASADLRLIAQSIAEGATLVTRETSDPNCVRRVKIPDVCKAFDVECIDPFAAYRRLGLRL
ncbi:DUF4411 family protein [Nigerium massiliense]|uniref:DUF4411 family protein n=1 Tax=Nigerium massiliense TaxID=1522317 RepID=UPI0009E658AB|nr:DUF4411 family protein [Nigerium massiliense]